MMNHVWRTEPNGDQSAVVFNLRLLIREGDRFSRWLLLGRSRTAAAAAKRCRWNQGAKIMLVLPKRGPLREPENGKQRWCPVKPYGRHLFETIYGGRL